LLLLPLSLLLPPLLLYSGLLMCCLVNLLEHPDQVKGPAHTLEGTVLAHRHWSSNKLSKQFHPHA
jgi:hypothetical protein